MAKTDKEYVDLSGFHCPVCDGTRVSTHGTHETHATYALQPCQCDECKAEWTDVYTLTSYEDLVDAFGHEIPRGKE